MLSKEQRLQRQIQANRRWAAKFLEKVNDKRKKEMSNKVYNVLKWVITVALPASGALYVGLAILWGWGYSDQVAGSIALIAAFGGTLLGISSIKYAKNNQ